MGERDLNMITPALARAARHVSSNICTLHTVPLPTRFSSDVARLSPFPHIPKSLPSPRSSLPTPRSTASGSASLPAPSPHFCCHTPGCPAHRTPLDHLLMLPLSPSPFASLPPSQTVPPTSAVPMSKHWKLQYHSQSSAAFHCRNDVLWTRLQHVVPLRCKHRFFPIDACPHPPFPSLQVAFMSVHLSILYVILRSSNLTERDNSEND